MLIFAQNICVCITVIKLLSLLLCYYFCFVFRFFFKSKNNNKTIISLHYCYLGLYKFGISVLHSMKLIIQNKFVHIKMIILYYKVQREIIFSKP